MSIPRLSIFVEAAHLNDFKWILIFNIMQVQLPSIWQMHYILQKVQNNTLKTVWNLVPLPVRGRKNTRAITALNRSDLHHQRVLLINTYLLCTSISRSHLQTGKAFQFAPYLFCSMTELHDYLVRYTGW